MSMSDAYDRAGQPITIEQWAALHSDADYKRVDAWTSADHEVHVSTVWLGIDHAYAQSTPLIFETFVFGGPLDAELDRYPTEAEACAGHTAMVHRVRAAIRIEQ